MKNLLLSFAVGLFLIGENYAQEVQVSLEKNSKLSETTTNKSDEEVDYNSFIENYSQPSVMRTAMERSYLPQGVSGYTTAIGIRGGYTTGLTLKHFVNSKAAVELIVGASRWRGTSLTGIYEWHKRNALEVPELTWVYGLGARIGFFDGRNYYDGYRGNCNDSNNPKCPSYWRGRSIAALGVVGIGGLEYKFKDAPITIGLDLIPYLYFNHYRGNFIDGSLSLRYVLK